MLNLIGTVVNEHYVGETDGDVILYNLLYSLYEEDVYYIIVYLMMNMNYVYINFNRKYLCFLYILLTHYPRRIKTLRGLRLLYMISFVFLFIIVVHVDVITDY